MMTHVEDRILGSGDVKINVESHGFDLSDLKAVEKCLCLKPLDKKWCRFRLRKKEKDRFAIFF